MPMIRFSSFCRATTPGFFCQLLTWLCLLGTSLSTAHGQRLAAGGEYSVSIRPDGTLWASGNNFVGQLGNGTRVDQSIPVQIGTANTWERVAASPTSHTAAIRTDGTLWTWGYNSAGQLGHGPGNNRLAPTQVGTDTWRRVAVGVRHTVAVRTDGTLWA